MYKDYNKNYGLFDALRCTALRHGYICESEYNVMCWIYTNKLWYGSETIHCVIKVLLYSWCISYTTNLLCKHKKQLFHCILLSIWCKCILPRWQFKMWGIFSSTMRGNTTAIGYEAKNDESTMEKAGKSNMPSRIHITFYSLEVFLISTPCTCFRALVSPYPFQVFWNQQTVQLILQLRHYTKTLTKTSTTGKLFLTFFLLMSILCTQFYSE